MIRVLNKVLILLSVVFFGLTLAFYSWKHAVIPLFFFMILLMTDYMLSDSGPKSNIHKNSIQKWEKFLSYAIFLFLAVAAICLVIMWISKGKAALPI